MTLFNPYRPPRIDARTERKALIIILVVLIVLLLGLLVDLAIQVGSR